jgi:UPF0271 protein
LSQAARSIDLNADLGEGCPWDELLLARVTSASISCGAHAGNRDGILATLRAAKARGVAVGAHPGYADREGFGRRERAANTDVIEILVRDQIKTLESLADEAEVCLRFVKPHGALYNQAHRDDAIAAGIAAAVKPFGFPILGQPGGRMQASTVEAGLRFVAEGFADRRYRVDGSLVPRTEPGAILGEHEEIRVQVLRLIDQGIETLCLHGDNPHSVELADLLLSTLKEHGVSRRSFI